MEDIIRSSDLTDAMRKLKAADEKINALTAAVSEWKLDIDADVEPVGDGFGVSVRLHKPNGSGIKISIDAEMAQYYADDTEALTRKITEQVFDKLYATSIRNVISPVLSRSLQNVESLRRKML